MPSETANFGWLMGQVTQDNTPRLDDIAREIARMLDPASYPANWDGEGAEPVNQECVLSAERLVRKVLDDGGEIPLSVYPLSDGSVMVEWELSHPERRVSVSIHPKNPSVGEALVYTPGIDSLQVFKRVRLE